MNDKTTINGFGSNFWLIVIVLMLAAFAGCKDDDNQSGNDPDIVNLSSVGYVSALTTDYEFAPATWDAWYELPLLPSRIAVVTASEDLLIEANNNVEVWEVRSDKVTEFETLIRSYWTYEGWEPDLFPQDYGQAQDLEVMISAFACAFSPSDALYDCPDWEMPSYLFRHVGDGEYWWENSGATKVVFLWRRR